jgi:DNA-binding protein YbaB
MNGIDGRLLHDAAAYVDECSQTATIHTVTISLNGAHGGADVTIDGTVEDAEDITGWRDYRREYEVH